MKKQLKGYMDRSWFSRMTIKNIDSSKDLILICFFKNKPKMGGYIPVIITPVKKKKK